MSLHATPWIDRPRLGTAPSALSNCTRLFQENQLKLLTELAEQDDGLGRSGKLLVPLAVSDTQLSRRQHCGSRDVNFKSPIAWYETRSISRPSHTQFNSYGWGRASGPFTNTGPAVRRTSHYTPAIAHFATSPRVSLPRTLQAKMQALGNWPFYATPCNGVRSGAPVHASAQESLQKFSKHEGFPSDKVLDSRCMLDQRRCAASYPEAKFDTCHRRISSNKNTKSGKAQLSVGTTPTTRTQHNLSLRRKFRRSVRLAILMHRIQVPARKGHQALLEVKHHLVRDAVRATLWEWPTVLAFFQQPSSDLQAITWPTATSVRIHPSCERNLEVPAGCIEGCALPSLLRAVGLNNNMIVCLLEARFGKWLPILCVLQKNGHPQGDWSLRESYPDCALSMLFYEDFRSALAPSTNELDDIREHYHNEIEKQAKSQERLKNREIARERKLKKVRQWVIDDLDEAFREWPPRVRKKQPAFKIRERQRALEYAMEAGRLGRKGGLSTIAVSFTGCGHVRLRSPGVRQCLYNCAREGMGFGGLSAKEIVETCYVYCAERLQAAWRGQILARKFARARALWVKCDHDLLRRVLVPWAQDSLRVACLRRACLRKLIAWCRWTKRRIYRKQVFRTCFWPFYTWRKEATASSKAREKARFLSLVWLHYTKLRNIRAWRMLTAKRTSDKRRADRYCRARTHEELAKKLSVWHIYASSRRRVRGIWLRRPNGGATLLRRILLTHLGKALVVWK